MYDIIQQDLMYEVDSQVKGISYLSSLFTRPNTEERVEIAAYKKISTIRYLVLAFEVQSSHMVHTLQKETYFAANVIGLLRFQEETFKLLFYGVCSTKHLFPKLYCKSRRSTVAKPVIHCFINLL